MTMGSFDRTQLPERLAFTESEFSWYIFEGEGAGRRIAGLVSIHRTGPRATSLSWSPQLLMGRDLPSPMRELVPGWLPILSPVRVETDDRPIFTVALYDLDSRAQPLHFEHEIEHASFDPIRFGASACNNALALDTDATGAASIEVRLPNFTLALQLTPAKPQIVFGHGSPTIRHGRITTNYVQRPRLSVTGEVTLGSQRIAPFVGEGVHDHQWLRVSVPNLKWIWPHLRLPDGRELTGYVIRDSTPGRFADADDGSEHGRGGWLIERSGDTRPVPTFDVRATHHVDTERGRVPTRFAVAIPELRLQFALEHVVPAPYLRMRAFGSVLDAGIYEGPIDVIGHPQIRGWVEVMNASHIGTRPSPSCTGRDG